MTNTFYRHKPGSLSVVVRSFKSAVAKMIHHQGDRTFAWQPRFYDHVIRDDKDLSRVREYIFNNPMQWALDEENPDRVDKS